MPAMWAPCNRAGDNGMTFDKDAYWEEKAKRKQLKIDLQQTRKDPKTQRPVPTKKAKAAQEELSKRYVAKHGIVGITPAFMVPKGEPGTRKDRRKDEVQGRGRRKREEARK
jgi:hypothetical protein